MVGPNHIPTGDGTRGPRRAQPLPHPRPRPWPRRAAGDGAAEVFRSRGVSARSPSVVHVRLIHTSDWHLGRAFHQVGLLDAQAAYLDHLVEVVRAESRRRRARQRRRLRPRHARPPTPSSCSPRPSQRLVDAGAQVVLSSGNHDSAIRLGFASGLLERAGRAHPDLRGRRRPARRRRGRRGPPPPLPRAGARRRRPRRHRAHPRRRAAGGDGPRCRADVAARGGRSVVMAHAFVTGGATSDSERDISVGGVCRRPAAVFRRRRLRALGHLHGGQEVAEGVRYCGSPVAMSFSEARHTKGSVAGRPLRHRARSSSTSRRRSTRPLRRAARRPRRPPRRPGATGRRGRVVPGDAHRPGPPARGHGPAARSASRTPSSSRFEPAGRRGRRCAATPRRSRRAPTTSTCAATSSPTSAGAARPTDDERALLAEAVEATRAGSRHRRRRGRGAICRVRAAAVRSDGGRVRLHRLEVDGVRAVRRPGHRRLRRPRRPRASSSSTGRPAPGKTSLLDAVCFALYADVPGRPEQAAGCAATTPRRDAVPTVAARAHRRRPRGCASTRSPEFMRPKKRGDGLAQGAGARGPRGARAAARWRGVTHPQRRGRRPRQGRRSAWGWRSSPRSCCCPRASSRRSCGPPPTSAARSSSSSSTSRRSPTSRPGWPRRAARAGPRSRPPAGSCPASSPGSRTPSPGWGPPAPRRWTRSTTTSSRLPTPRTAVPTAA